MRTAERPRMVGDHATDEASERGSATVGLAVVVAALVFLAGLFAVLTEAWVARTQVQLAADLAALAGADVSSVSVFEAHPDPSLACAQASLVAQQNGAAVSSCRVEGSDTLVTVTRASSSLLRMFSVTARARAGPGT